MAYTNQNYILSKYIHIFPCAYRGQRDPTELFDPESRLNTEKNLSNIGLAGFPRITSYENGCYVISSTIDKLCFVIGGYYVEILNEVEIEKLHGKYLCIKFTDKVISDDFKTTYLQSWEDDTDANLDRKLSGETNYSFTGLLLVESLPNPNPSKYYFKIFDENGNIDHTKFLPRILSGTTSDHTAVAIGNGLTAGNPYMLAIGQYNSCKSGDIFEIGGGTASVPKNILEVSTSDVILNNTLTTNASIIVNLAGEGSTLISDKSIEFVNSSGIATIYYDVDQQNNFPELKINNADGPITISGAVGVNDEAIIMEGSVALENNICPAISTGTSVKSINIGATNKYFNAAYINSIHATSVNTSNIISSNASITGTATIEMASITSTATINTAIITTAQVGTLQSTGTQAIAVTSPVISSVATNKYAFGLASNTFYVTGAGKVTAQSYNALSDKRLKENIEKFEPKQTILDLNVYKYDFITGAKNQIGCIAQELQEICPEIVQEDENGYLSIQESKLVYLLLDEVKKLRKEVDELKKER